MRKVKVILKITANFLNFDDNGKPIKSGSSTNLKHRKKMKKTI